MELLWTFYLYSLLGFGLEVVYANLTGAAKRDRKCRLFLPICPVYGLGAAAILALPDGIRGHWLPLFLASAALAAGVEYLTALFYERCWYVRFWDYSGLPGSVQGRVCLPFALAWGVLGVALVRLVQPILHPWLMWLPWQLLLPLTLVYAVDLALTGRVLRATGSTRALQWYRV